MDEEGGLGAAADVSADTLYLLALARKQNQVVRHRRKGYKYQAIESTQEHFG